MYSFYILSAALCAMFVSYAYLLNKTIADVVYVEIGQKKQLELSSKLAILENVYLRESSSLTLEKAYSRGFVNDNKPHYLSLKSFPQALSLAGQDSGQ